MFQFKVVLVGDSRVGKTAFLKRFTESYFTTDMHPTIGVDLRMHDFTVDGKTVKLEVRERLCAWILSLFSECALLLLLLWLMLASYD